MRRTNLTHIAFAAGILALTGCQSRDPYYRTDVWKPTGANAANIAAMVANPYDLIHGRRNDGVHLSKDQIPAVERAWSGAVIKSSSGAGSGGSSAAGSASGG